MKDLYYTLGVDHDRDTVVYDFHLKDSNELIFTLDNYEDGRSILSMTLDGKLVEIDAKKLLSFLKEAISEA